MNKRYLIAGLAITLIVGCSGHSREENAVYEKVLDAGIMAQAGNGQAFRKLFGEAQLLYGRLRLEKKLTKENETHLDLAMTHGVLLNIRWDGVVRDSGAQEQTDCLMRELALFKDPKKPAPTGSCKSETINP
jgi:hypothetical protein